MDDGPPRPPAQFGMPISNGYFLAGPSLSGTKQWVSAPVTAATVKTVKIRFGEEHLRCFSDASLDFNPLHLSKDYARRTSSGECVVHGILGFLACLREIRMPDHQTPSEVRIDFKSPLVLDVDYTITVDAEAFEGVRITIADGSAAMMRARLRFRRSAPESISLPENGTAPLRYSRGLNTTDLERLPAFRGAYAPARAAYQELLSSLAIDPRAWGDALPLAALCSSYLTGMELPGESATYSGLRLNILGTPPQVPFDYEIALDSYDSRFGMVKSRFALGAESAIWASGGISAISRAEHHRGVAACPAAGTGRFSGKCAVIIGASRGLGAAMALELVAEGGTVIGVYSRSQEDSKDLLAASRNLPGRLIMERGDASDLTWCVELRDRVRAELGALDLLVCNAAPAIPSLRVEEACYDRILAYIGRGLALVGAPLSAFLKVVSAPGGCVLAVSSSAVEEPPAAWPHYVAMKAAVEGLVRTVAVANPKVTFCIARPGRMLTDMSDTPIGRLDAEAPQPVARRILEHVWEGVASGTVLLCR